VRADAPRLFKEFFLLLFEKAAFMLPITSIGDRFPETSPITVTNDQY
jgi:hypothetical protein